MAQLLETIEIETGSQPDAAVIWLHGLGADGHDFEPIVPELQLPQRLSIRFIFPHAPVRPVTLNQGMRMRAWYDILQLGGGREDEPGIRASQKAVEDLIAREGSRGIAARRIVLAGFSQGGAIVLQTSLRYPERLAGTLALSTYLPLAGTLAAERSALNQDLPIFMAHGSQDPMIPLDRARFSRDALAALGYPVQWREYPMPHSVCLEELADIATWLTQVL
ncbi:MAG TPA: alpha/beta fold hydrolase [Burkholderiales bacterium]|jgi:phospholipase/carboxylesterase|nr:alpha/beta fold hydrolase [Burkholderiales bacterium]